MTTEFARHATLPIEARRSCQTNTCYRPHAHDCFSIGLIDEGTSVFSSAGCPAVRLSPGDTIIIPSGCVHSCNPLDNRWLYQMIHFDQGWLASLIPDSIQDALFHRVRVLHDPQVYEGVNRFNHLLFEDAKGTNHAKGTRDTASDREGDLTSLLTHTLSLVVDLGGEEIPDGRSRQRASLRPALDLLADTVSSPTSPGADALADAASMSWSRFVREMKRTTGLTPVAWRQNERINRARTMIREGHPLADTAADLGFSDQSHLTRVFRAHVAASPGEYRA